MCWEVLSEQVSLLVLFLTCSVGLSPVLLGKAGVVGIMLTAGRSREVVGLTPSLPLPSTDMETVNPNFVTVATSTTDLLEPECNVTEGAWGKDF